MIHITLMDILLATFTEYNKYIVRIYYLSIFTPPVLNNIENIILSTLLVPYLHLPHVLLLSPLRIFELWAAWPTNPYFYGLELTSSRKTLIDEYCSWIPVSSRYKKSSSFKERHSLWKGSDFTMHFTSTWGFHICF